MTQHNRDKKLSEKIDEILHELERCPIYYQYTYHTKASEEIQKLITQAEAIGAAKLAEELLGSRQEIIETIDIPKFIVDCNITKITDDGGNSYNKTFMFLEKEITEKIITAIKAKIEELTNTPK